MARAVVLRELGELVAARGGGEPVRVGVDGRGASGKTTLADELAREVASRGREVIRGSVDGFLRPRAERYARGRDSAEGYYHDARDWDALRRLLLEPMGRAGDRLYRTRSFDEAEDRPLHEPARRAAADAVVIVDGTYLQRPELAGCWELVIFVDVPDDVAMERALARDAARLGGREAAAALYARRYRPAWAMYEAMCRPRERADAVVENGVFERLRVAR